jgi:hypothetical protein
MRFVGIGGPQQGAPGLARTFPDLLCSTRGGKGRNDVIYISIKLRDSPGGGVELAHEGSHYGMGYIQRSKQDKLAVTASSSRFNRHPTPGSS